MSDDLYDADILLWSEHQAALLRRLAKLYRRASRGLPSVVGDALPKPVPPACPWTLDELLQDP